MKTMKTVKALTWMDCAEKVLAASAGPMHTRDMVEAILKRDLYQPTHKDECTDQNTITQLLFQEIDSRSNRFVWCEPATFDIRTRYTADKLALMDHNMAIFRSQLKRSAETSKPTTHKKSHTLFGFTIRRNKI